MRDWGLSVSGERGGINGNSITLPVETVVRLYLLARFCMEVVDCVGDIKEWSIPAAMAARVAVSLSVVETEFERRGFEIEEDS